MKALTISQPFASLIADGEKWVENRTWPIGYRGSLAIHAGKGTQYLDRKELAEFPHGCVVAIARLTGCVQLSAIRSNLTGEPERLLTGTDKTVAELLGHEHTEGPWCWVLEYVRAIDEPIPYRGAQGLWNFPDELVPVMSGQAAR